MKKIGHWSGASLSGASWNVYEGDAAAVLQDLPAEYYHCVVTSPPYYWLRDYGISGQIGHEETVSGYVEAMASVMDKVYRVLRKDGLLFLNIGDTYYSGRGKSHGVDPKSAKRRFGLRAVDKSGAKRNDLITGCPVTSAPCGLLSEVKRIWFCALRLRSQRRIPAQPYSYEG